MRDSQRTITHQYEDHTATWENACDREQSRKAKSLAQGDLRTLSW